MPRLLLGLLFLLQNTQLVHARLDRQLDQFLGGAGDDARIMIAGADVEIHQAPRIPRSFSPPASRKAVRSALRHGIVFLGEGEDVAQQFDLADAELKLSDAAGEGQQTGALGDGMG